MLSTPQQQQQMRSLHDNALKTAALQCHVNDCGLVVCKYYPSGFGRFSHSHAYISLN